jgi:hypothetical protein
LILAIVLRNYSTKLCYIFQLKRELKVWKYIFNLFHFGRTNGRGYSSIPTTLRVGV